MILTQYLILASEFVQHITMIVLVGFMVTECVACYASLVSSRAGLFDVEEEARFRKQKRVHLLLLVAVILATLWFIVEFFVNENPWYHLFLHTPVITAILVMLWSLAREGNAISKRIFTILFVAAVTHMSLDVLSFFDYHLLWDHIARAVLKTVQALALYFFVLTHAILNSKIKSQK